MSVLGVESILRETDAELTDVEGHEGGTGVGLVATSSTYSASCVTARPLSTLFIFNILVCLLGGQRSLH